MNIIFSTIKKTFVLPLIAASTLLVGCSDWLDYTPKDKQTYEQQFATVEGFRNAVNGVYTKMSASSLYGYNLSYGPLDIMGQLYSIPSTNVSRYELSSYSWTGTYASGVFSSIWNSAYSCILNANLVLQAADEQRGAVLNESDYALIKGEMLAVRSFLHFDLLRLFGPVYSRNSDALSIPYNDGVQALRRERLSAKDLIQTKLLPDIQAAEDYLKNIDPVIKDGVLASDGGEDGNWARYRQLRMNYYAVILLKARVLLWEGEYNEALTEARKITDDSRVKEIFPFVDPTKLLANTINPDRVFSTECFFGFYLNGMSDVYYNNFNGTLNLTQLMQPRSGYVDALYASSSDYRRQSQWTGSASAGGSEYDFIKYRSFTTSSTNPDFHATFFGLMRLSEAYYIAAECSLNNGNLNDACRYLNTILSERGVEPVDDTKATTASVLKQIEMEYVREMRGEGQVFFLFKRLYLNLSGANADLNGARQLNSESIGERYVIPIPESEIN